METNKNYQQQQINGKEQTVILDSSLTAETDEMNASFPTSGPPVDPEEDDDEFPTKEDLGEEEDPGLNHDENDDLSLNIEEDDDDKLY